MIKTNLQETNRSLELTSNLMPIAEDSACSEITQVSHEMIWRTLLTNNATPWNKPSDTSSNPEAFKFWQMYAAIVIRAGSSASRVFGPHGGQRPPSDVGPPPPVSEGTFEVTDELVQNSSDEEFQEFVEPFRDWVRLRLRSRQLMQSAQHGFPGLAPTQAGAGDLVCVLKGCDHPVILRKMNEDDTFLFIGQAHIPQLANAQVLQMEEKGEVNAQLFPIR